MALGSMASDYISVVRDLGPLVAEYRQNFDRDRCLSAPVFAALIEAGLFRLWLPRSQGGPQFSPLEFMEIVEEAAALDGSIGWLVGNGAGMSRVGGYLDPEVSKGIFEDPLAFVVSGTMPNGLATPCDGGYLVSGRWTFGSGSNHATWFMGRCRSADSNDGNPHIACYFNARDVEIFDTWHVSGLKATRSNDYEVKDLFVPQRYSHPYMNVQATEDDTLYRLPTPCIFPWTVAVVPLGIARGAMACAADIASGKGRLGNSVLLRDQESVQTEFGRCGARIEAARALLKDAMMTLMTTVDEGGDSLAAAQINFRSACTHAADTARTVIDKINASLGAVAIFETSPLERYQRDILAAAKHIAMSSKNYTVAGRVSLGLDPGQGF